MLLCKTGMSLCSNTNPYYKKDTEPFTLKKNTLPTNDEVLRYYFSRRNAHREQQTDKITTLSSTIEKLWSDADCCPIKRKYIVTKIQDLVSLFHQFIRPNKSHKKQKSAVHVKPTRRSARSTVKVGDSPDSEAESSLHVSPDELEETSGEGLLD